MNLIGYQGVKGSYSESLITSIIDNSEPVSCENFKDVFKMLKEGKIDYGLIPIENNLGGSLHINYDLLLEYGFKIISEYNYPINHCLICHPEVEYSNIKKVISHYQVLAQCANYIKDNNFESSEYFDTGGAIKMLSESQDRNIAGIASERAALTYGMKILKRNVQDNKINITRFLLLARDDKDYILSETNKISLAICLHNRSGILAEALSIFSDLGIDLTKIESRPNLVYRNNENIPYQYIFYIDFIGKLEDYNIILAISKLEKLCLFMKILGNYQCIYSTDYFIQRLNIGIIGFGRFGQFLSKYLSTDHNVFATSRTDYSEISKEIGVNFVHDQDEFKRENLDCVIISTSILSFEKVLESLGKDFLKGKLIIDVLSVKCYAKEILLNMDIDCDILCTHPMFGPDSGSNDWLNLPFVYDKVRVKDNDRCNIFLSFFEKRGCKMHEMTCEDHDEYGANSQFITHLTGRLLSELNIKSTPINTTGYESLLNLVKYTNNDSFELFEGLYKNNSKSVEVLEKFRSSLDNIIFKLRKDELNESVVKESGTSYYSRLISEYRGEPNFIDFSIGQPDYDPPVAIKDYACNVINNERVTYTDISGIKSLRKGISKFLERRNLHYNENEILCSNGAKQSIYQTLLFLLNKGGEVIIPSPYWTSYPSMVELVGGTPIIYETNFENSFQIDCEELEKLINNKTRAIIICNPCNPTGVIYNRKTLLALSELVKKYNIFVISDEVYEMIDYNNTFVSIGSFENMKDRTFIINSFSKGFAMTGYRLGYVATKQEYIKQLVAIQSQITGGPCYISQRCGEEILTDVEDVSKTVINLKESMNIFYNGLIGIKGIKCVKPNGGIYLFPNVSYYFGKNYNGNIIKNVEDFCKYLLKDYKIGVLPGTIFGSSQNIRISYGVDKSKIWRANILLNEYLSKLI